MADSSQGGGDSSAALVPRLPHLQNARIDARVMISAAELDNIQQRREEPKAAHEDGRLGG